MLLHLFITEDIVINKGVLARSEIPWFLCWVVWLVLQSLELIVKVNDIECLLIPEYSIL